MKLTKLESFVKDNPNTQFDVLRDQWNAVNKRQVTWQSLVDACDRLHDKQHQEAVNVFNPEGIKAGDLVKLKDPRKGEPKRLFKVSYVGGTYGNKVSLVGPWPGHQLYAQCFDKVQA